MNRLKEQLHGIYLAIIGGQHSDFLSRLLLAGLLAWVPVYYIIIRLRNWRFDRAEARMSQSPGVPPKGLIRQASIPVISVGNLTTGGTGKTPLVAWLARLIHSSGHKVAVISRGYRSQHESQKNDETLELMARLPEIDFLNGRSRHDQVQIAVGQLGTEVAILDDGFQHRQLYRDLDFVLIDATNPFGYGRLLPAGLLREPLASLKRADVIVLTRCELVAQKDREHLRQRIEKLNPKALVLEAGTKAIGWITDRNQQLSLSHWQSVPQFAFCGIGNPGNFIATLKKLGCQVNGSEFFPDHHHFSTDDWGRLTRQARQAGAEVLVCTHKDLVKMAGCSDGRMPLVALLTETILRTHQEELTERIAEVIGRKDRKTNATP